MRGMNPTIAGLLRGAALAIGTAAIDGAITYFSGSSVTQIAPALAPWQPAIVIVLRTVEGVVDNFRKQSNPAVGA